eukprot:4562819-Pyramimonas_sp.AAC.1
MRLPHPVRPRRRPSEFRASLARRRSAQRQKLCPLSSSQLALFAPRSGRPACVAWTPRATCARRGGSALRCARSLGLSSGRAKRE